MGSFLRNRKPVFLSRKRNIYIMKGEENDP
jgi:hypothetical protein